MRLQRCECRQIRSKIQPEDYISILLWWVAASECFLSADGEDQRAIERQRSGGCPARGSERNDCVNAPAKMVSPQLRTWIE
jgi:hypothetical protein